MKRITMRRLGLVLFGINSLAVAAIAGPDTRTRWVSFHDSRPGQTKEITTLQKRMDAVLGEQNRTHLRPTPSATLGILDHSWQKDLARSSKELHILLFLRSLELNLRKVRRQKPLDIEHRTTEIRATSEIRVTPIIPLDESSEKNGNESAAKWYGLGEPTASLISYAGSGQEGFLRFFSTMSEYPDAIRMWVTSSKLAHPQLSRFALSDGISLRTIGADFLPATKTWHPFISPRVFTLPHAEDRPRD